MAKKFFNTRCIHCLKYFEELTSDHVLPKAWYPDDTPSDIERWQVPSCHKCNWEYGKVEEQLLSRLGLHFDPQKGNFTKIANKVARAMNPNYGKSERDCQRRNKQRNCILHDINLVANIDYSESNILPGFGANSKDISFQQIPLTVPEKELIKFSNKVTRGVFYLVNNKLYIESDYECTIYFPSENYPIECRQIIHQYGKQYNCGPGINVVIAVCFDDVQSALLEITIWNLLKFCSEITKIQS